MPSLVFNRLSICSLLSLLALTLVACGDEEEKVQVHRADAERAAVAAVYGVKDRTSPSGYQTQIRSFGEAGPVVRMVDVAPSYWLDAFGGRLMGDDRGEFGGELMFRDRQGDTHLLLKKNVHGIFQMPFGVVVFTGLAHMRSNVGGVYLVSDSSESIPVTRLFHDLDGAPSEVIRALSGELVFKVFNGRFERDRSGSMAESKDCYLMGKRGEIKKLRCESIVAVD